MNPSLKRRLTVACCWATTRTSMLDGFQRYEDSYAITQEFREWITCIGDYPEQLELSTLQVPDFPPSTSNETPEGFDEMLEI